MTDMYYKDTNGNFQPYPYLKKTGDTATGQVIFDLINQPYQTAIIEKKKSSDNKIHQSWYGVDPDGSSAWINYKIDDTAYNSLVLNKDATIINKQLRRGGQSSSWIKGRDASMVRQTSHGANQYTPALSMKTDNGSWEIGPYTDNKLWFSYCTDTNYNNNTNSPSGQLSLSPSSIGGSIFLNSIYPIGSIYITVSDTSPASLFGGSWSEVGAGYYLMASGTSYTRASTGGANNITLTVNQIPAHNHTTNVRIDPTFRSGDGTFITATNSGGGSGWRVESPSDKVTINNTGGGQSHSNMPAYYAVRIWRRTA